MEADPNPQQGAAAPTVPRLVDMTDDEYAILEAVTGRNGKAVTQGPYFGKNGMSIFTYRMSYLKQFLAPKWVREAASSWARTDHGCDPWRNEYTQAKWQQ